MSATNLLVLALGFVVLLVLTQDIHIFPGALTSKIRYFSQKNKRPPQSVESIFIESVDGPRLEVWRHASQQMSQLNKYVAIIFHGNGGPVEHFLFIQMWLAELGIVSYNFDYRGFGRSGGWPSEKGIAQDGEAVWQYVLQREQLGPERIIVVGISVGSGPASRIAAQYHPKLLLLSSAFTDLRCAVRSHKIVGLLSPFVWHKFPTIDHVRALKSTDLVIAHGMNDKIVPPGHSVQLEASYGGQGRVRRFASDSAGHNLAFYALKDELSSTLIGWLG